MLRRSVGFVVERCVVCISVRLLQSHSHNGGTGPSVFRIVERFKRTWPFGFLVCSLPTTNCRVGSDHEAS